MGAGEGGDAHLTVSVREFQKHVHGLLGSMRRKVASLPRNLAVWVNGSASSIALAILATECFSEMGSRRVLAVVTPLADRMDDFEALADDLRTAGVEVVLAKANSPVSLPTPGKASNMRQMSFLLRQCLLNDIKMIMTWHTHTHQLYYHLAKLRRLNNQLDLGIDSDIAPYQDPAVLSEHMQLQSGTFQLLRPLLQIAEPRLAATCRSYKISPVVKDDGELCEDLSSGKQLFSRLSQSGRKGLMRSIEMVGSFRRDNHLIAGDFMREMVVYGKSRHGMVVVHRRRITDAVDRYPGLYNIFLAILTCMIIALSGSRSKGVERQQLSSLLKRCFLTEAPVGFTLRYCRFLPLQAESPLVGQLNDELVVHESSQSPDAGGPANFEDGDLVAIFREEAPKGKDRNLQDYVLRLDLNETKIWDGRFVVGAFSRPPQQLLWPSASDFEFYSDTVFKEGKSPSSVSKQSLMTLLDDLCEDPPERRNPGQKYPFEVSNLRFDDVLDLIKRHPPLRTRLSLNPMPVLRTIPCFRRHGEILAVPSLGINYEPRVNFSATLLLCPSLLPPDLDPSIDLKNWVRN